MFFLYIKERGRSWLQYYYVNVRRLIEHCLYNTYWKTFQINFSDIILVEGTYDRWCTTKILDFELTMRITQLNIFVIFNPSKNVHNMQHILLVHLYLLHLWLDARNAQFTSSRQARTSMIRPSVNLMITTHWFFSSFNEKRNGDLFKMPLRVRNIVDDV